MTDKISPIAGQFDFEGRSVQSVSLLIPGVGLVPLVIEGDLRVTIGDRITYSQSGVIRGVTFDEPMDKEGRGKAPMGRIARVQNIPSTFELTEIKRRQVIDEAWADSHRAESV